MHQPSFRGVVAALSRRLPRPSLSDDIICTMPGGGAVLVSMMGLTRTGRTSLSRRFSPCCPAKRAWIACTAIAICCPTSSTVLAQCMSAVPIPSPPTSAGPRHARVSNIWSPAGRSSSCICSDPSHQRGRHICPGNLRLFPHIARLSLLPPVS
jgi:hypothetical protein